MTHMIGPTDESNTRPLSVHIIIYVFTVTISTSVWALFCYLVLSIILPFPLHLYERFCIRHQFLWHHAVVVMTLAMILTMLVLTLAFWSVVPSFAAADDGFHCPVSVNTHRVACHKPACLARFCKQWIHLHLWLKALDVDHGNWKIHFCMDRKYHEPIFFILHYAWYFRPIQMQKVLRVQFFYGVNLKPKLPSPSLKTNNDKTETTTTTTTTRKKRKKNQQQQTTPSNETTT